MSRQLTSATTLDNLKREARRRLKALRAGDAAAQERFQQAYPRHTGAAVLRDVQHALAREFGHDNWKALKLAIQAAAVSRTLATYQQAAADFVEAHRGDPSALARLNRYYDRSFTTDDLRAEVWRRDYAYRQRSRKVPENYLPIEEAQTMLAHDAGFSSWEKLMAAVASGAPPEGSPYVLHTRENRIGPSRRMSDADWDALIGVMKEKRISALVANGMMTDAALAKIAELEFVTSLHLGGSRELTDDGLLHLTRMPQLERLELSEYPGGKLTDRGLEALRHLPNLRKFEMTWQAGITDRGTANLRFCDRLEEVDLMGSPTGDGTVEALQGKEHLRRFSSGRLLTDAGLALLHHLPLFKEHRGGQARLLIDGPVTDAGLEQLAGLSGVFDLDLFWHTDRITSGGFAHLHKLPNLEALCCDGRLSDNEAMRYIGMLPRLKQLRSQESVATDEGFEALARSQTLEGIWGRVCPNFGSRGFIALSKMASLNRLGIGCRNVEAAALARLPEFPALRDLTPIDFQDSGFQYVGRCPHLERLSCMYCRETGDAATAFLKDLRLHFYYAGLTQITDRSLEILGGIETLEQVNLYECQKVSDAGIPFLARLPRLREVHLEGLPGVTLKGAQVFRPGVHVYYSP